MKQLKIIKDGSIITHLIIFNKKYKIKYNKDKSIGSIDNKLFYIVFYKTPPKSMFYNDMNKWSLASFYPLNDSMGGNNPEAVINEYERRIVKINNDTNKLINEK